VTRGRIIPLTLREANDFVEKHHRHSARTSNDGGKFAVGLEFDDQLVGAAIVGRPIARMLQQPGTAELLRCCVGPGAPDGAGKTLNARCKRIWQLMGGSRLVTYTLSTESGGSLSGAGFRKVAKAHSAQWQTRGRPPREIAGKPKDRWEANLQPRSGEGVEPRHG
jgi:hypothetical protein